MSDKSVALQEFTAHAVTVQSFERVAQQAPGWAGLDVVQRQAVNVALDAIARVLHGDAQNAGVWACGATALSLAGEFVTVTPAEDITPPMSPEEAQRCREIAAEYDARPKADADGWIEWHGGECPVSAETDVEVRFRKGGASVMAWAKAWDWAHTETGGGIIAYRVVE
jgi:hypothetical protein